MKTIQLKHSIIAACAALALAVSSNVVRAQANNIFFGPAGSEASLSNPDGTWIHLWGGGTANILEFDTHTIPLTGDRAGSVYGQMTWAGSAGDNYNSVADNNTWFNNPAYAINGNQYTNIVMDFKYDTTSTISPSTAAHVDFALDAGYWEQYIETINSTTIDPVTSTPYFDGNWHHLAVTIPSAMGNIGSVFGPSEYTWNPSGTSGTMGYWMANVAMLARIVPLPPPTNYPPTTATSGLSEYASTEGNAFFDRQSALFTTNSGTSWLDSNAQYPVKYSFNIASFSTNAATYGAEAWLFLSPSPSAIDNAPDWNETNMVIAFIQDNTNGATLNLQYKVNEDHQQAMYNGGSETRIVAGVTNHYYYSAAPGSLPGGAIVVSIGPNEYNVTNESGNLTNVVYAKGPLGTWTIEFDSPTDGKLIAPDNITTSAFTIPPYNITYLEPNGHMNVYLGMQANVAAFINQAVVYANFAMSGVPAAFADDFTADTVLNTNAWVTGQASGPGSILITKTGPLLTWSLPDNGYTLQDSTNLVNPLGWSSPANNNPFALYHVRAQNLGGSDIPVGKTAFFRLIKRVYTQLQVLLPGEIAAPNTLTGKTGTPDVQAAYTPFNVIVNAVDVNFNVVNINNTVQISDPGDANFASLSGTDLTGTMQPLVSGTTTYSVEFTGDGSSAMTVIDQNDNTKTGTSGIVTY